MQLQTTGSVKAPGIGDLKWFEPKTIYPLIMSGHIGLYYPFIHFRDESWLKLTSLYWDRMGRIVPEGYSLRDNDTVRQFKDSGYIRNFHPGGAQARPGLAFRELLAAHGDQLRERYGLHLSANWPDDPATVWSRAAQFGDKKLSLIHI